LMSAYQQVAVEIDGAIGTVTLNRPDKLNAFTVEMVEELQAALGRLAGSEAVRAIVVTGAGSSFCPGLDSQRLDEAATSAGLQLDGRLSQHFPLTVPKPMIAAINGACAGIGLVQALVCDVRFMARGARLSTAYAKLGIPAEYGLSWLLPRMIGVERALDLLLSARRVDAEEAERIGLVSRVCDREDVVRQAREYAHLLARSCSPVSMATIRRQVWGDLSRGYTEANQVWLSAMRRLNQTDNPDFAEGVAALIEKREPRFSPLPAIELPLLPPFVEQ